MPAPSLLRTSRFSVDHARPSRVSMSDDPLAFALRPPANESADARARRIAEEDAALRRSRAIDEQLANEKKALEMKNKAVRVLLLGQSESGKSTTLKNFELAFAPAQFKAERRAWRVVVQLNLIASVRIIVDALQDELADMGSSALNFSDPSPTTTSNPFASANSASVALARARSTRPFHGASHDSNAEQMFGLGRSGRPLPLTSEHRKLILRLSALLQVEKPLARAINPDTSLFQSNATQGFASESDANTSVETNYTFGASTSRELFVRAGDGWKHSVFASEHLEHEGQAHPSSNRSTADYGDVPIIQEPNCVVIRKPHMPAKIFDGRKSCDYQLNQLRLPVTLKDAEQEELWERDVEWKGAASVLAACREDIVSLWSDPTVRSVLSRRKVDVESHPGFFLEDADRIARGNYEPSESDVLRARLQTLGVQEHILKMETRTSIRDPKRDWIIYDVGGHRSNRHKWIPYFENVDAIIFLAPLTFTQTLAEDPRINRLEDSFSLWKKICAHPLLARATIVLFLNKIDLMNRTLERGVRLRDYIPSFGDQPNNQESAIKFFRSKFKAYQKSLSPLPRSFYCHETTVINAEATAIILHSVRDGIIYQNLRDVNVI